MTVVHKFFLSFADELRWLEKMNKDGYELMSVSPMTYKFEKNDNRVQYEYIPLRHGKKSFIALDYKNKDKNTKVVYASYDIALFKKSQNKGLPAILTTKEKRLAFERYRSSLSLHSIIYIAIFAMLSLIAGRFSVYPLYIMSAFFLIFSASGFYNASKTEKYIKKLKSQT